MLAMPLRCGGILSPIKRPFKLSTNPTLRCHCSALQEWRNTPINENRSWGPTGPQPSDVRPPPFSGDDSTTASSSSLADYAALILSTPDPLLKSRISHIAFSRWRNHFLPVGTVLPPDHPARPARPVLVPPKEIPTHKSLGLPLNVYLLHNLAHVELNAIDLAWDTVARFSPLHDFLGDVFFSDFARVADDESRHFIWCSQRLTELGFSYGDMPAHNFLWRECNKSSGDVAARLAVIPLVQTRARVALLFLLRSIPFVGTIPSHARASLPSSSADGTRMVFGDPMSMVWSCLTRLEHGLLFSFLGCRRTARAHKEARGLDSGPRLVQKLIGFGDHRTSNIVAQIAEEEVAHVAVGVFWFALLCQKMGRTPSDTFKDLLKGYSVELKGPFNYVARDKAGMPRDWYDDDSLIRDGIMRKLSEVHERLETIISMEKESSKLG